VFGREPGVDIRVTDALVSRRHAELRWSDDSGGGWSAADLASRNGVLVDGQRIGAPTRVADGATVQVGGQVFRLHLLPPGGDPASVGSHAPQISALETMGPGVGLVDLACQGATFTGEVTGGVPELLQFFLATAKTGRLDLVGGSAGKTAASVWMVQGTPVHASFAPATGMQALLRLAIDPPPRFAFHAGAAPPADRTLKGSATAILMELARQMDEAHR
jgi:hypothetical protein